MKIKDQAHGVIVVFRDKYENKFLLLRQKPQFEGDINWTFPKGHSEEGESPRDSALRELFEETGIKDIDLVEDFSIHEEYITPKGNLKINQYFLGFVKDKNITIQEDEIDKYAWLTYKEALETFTRQVRINSLNKAQGYLTRVL